MDIDQNEETPDSQYFKELEIQPGDPKLDIAQVAYDNGEYDDEEYDEEGDAD